MNAPERDAPTASSGRRVRMTDMEGDMDLRAAIERIVEDELHGLPQWRSELTDRLTAAALAAISSAAPEGLDELRALSEKATPGPWHRRGREVEDEKNNLVAECTRPNNVADAAFIVAAVNYARARLSEKP